MANPQKENGFTPISNEILENIIKYEFPRNTGSMPIKLCFFIIRKTYGYQKKMDIISLSQFQEALDEKSRTNLVYWLNYLVQAKILVRIKKSNMQIEYGFNKDYEQWIPLVQAKGLVQARKYTGTSASTETSTSHSTHKRNKETTKEIGETSSQDISLLIKSFETLNPASKKFYGNITQRKACEALIREYGFERVKTIVEKTLPKTNGLQFFPTITTPLQLQDKWVALESAVRKYQAEKQIIKNKVAF